MYRFKNLYSNLTTSYKIKALSLAYYRILLLMTLISNTNNLKCFLIRTFICIRK